MSAAAGPRWLDALARRAARGEVATAAAVSPVAVVAGNGLSRRTLLRAAGAAALLGGPLRLLIPAPAQADATSDCVVRLKKKAYEIFQGCVKTPGENFTKYQTAIDLVTQALKGETSARKRKRLLKILDDATAGFYRVAREIEACNTTFLELRADAERACYVRFHPPSGGGGGGGPGGSPCASGTTACSDGLCCFGSDMCCSCNGTAQCCVAEVGCACCG